MSEIYLMTKVSRSRDLGPDTRTPSFPMKMMSSSVCHINDVT